MKEFYILSVKHSPLGNSAMWWGPNNKGYFEELSNAGKYTQEEVDSDPAYYNNGESTIAVPRDEAEMLSRPVVLWTTIINRYRGKNV